MSYHRPRAESVSQAITLPAEKPKGDGLPRRRVGKYVFTEEQWLEWIERQIPGFVPWTPGEWRTEQSLQRYLAEDGMRQAHDTEMRRIAFKVLGEEMTGLNYRLIEKEVQILALQDELNNEKQSNSFYRKFYDLWWKKRVAKDKEDSQQTGDIDASR